MLTYRLRVLDWQRKPNKKLKIRTSAPVSEYDFVKIISVIATHCHEMIKGIADHSLLGKAYRIYPLDNEFYRKKIRNLRQMYKKQILKSLVWKGQHGRSSVVLDNPEMLVLLQRPYEFKWKGLLVNVSLS